MLSVLLGLPAGQTCHTRGGRRHVFLVVCGIRYSLNTLADEDKRVRGPVAQFKVTLTLNSKGEHIAH